MREILFRAKTVPDCKDIMTGKIIKTPKWIYGYVDLGYMHDCGVPIISDEKGNKTYKCQYESIGQFTGLYDSTKWEELTTEEQALFLYPENGGKRSKEDWKGKPIFECDVVECFSSDYAGRPKIETIIVRDMTDYNTMVYLNCSNKLKIIGNIHDNPELLEVKK